MNWWYSGWWRMMPSLRPRFNSHQDPSHFFSRCSLWVLEFYVIFISLEFLWRIGFSKKENSFQKLKKNFFSFKKVVYLAFIFNRELRKIIKNFFFNFFWKKFWDFLFFIISQKTYGECIRVNSRWVYARQ